jgi:hypothetical protein
MSIFERDCEFGCSQCYGRGAIEHWESRKDEVCGACNGLGVELTDIGKELITFLKQYFNLTPKKR